jgi:16S rRNA (guanine527-N7)-methyltransferase
MRGRSGRDTATSNLPRRERSSRKNRYNSSQRPVPSRRRPAAPTDSIMRRQNWPLLEPHLLRLGADVPAVMKRLRSYGTLLLDWNGNFSNLISRSDTSRLVERHMLEAIEPAHWLKASGAIRWLDLGSGGGLPALPLALSGVGEHWTLVESRRNKTLFLRKAVQDLKIDGVNVVLDRLENLPDPAAGAEYDGFTSRATLSLIPTLEMAARFVRPGGFAYLWKGSRREEEMAADASWQKHWELDGLLGIGGGQTVVTRFKRKQSV